MWDKASLHDLIATKMSDYQIIVVANREAIYPPVRGRLDRVPTAGERDGRCSTR